MDGGARSPLPAPAILGTAAASLALGALARQCWRRRSAEIPGGSNDAGPATSGTASASERVNAGGRLVFVTGASGSGKTTLGEGLRQCYGFVHVDGDRWTAGLNPVSDGLAPSQEELQTEAAERHRRQRAPLVQAFWAAMRRFGAKFDPQWPEWEPFYAALAEEIRRQRALPEHQGRDIVVTHACYSRVVRDALRAELPGVVFLVLDVQALLLQQRKLERFEQEAQRSGMTLKQYVMQHPHLKVAGATFKERVARITDASMACDPPTPDEVDTHPVIVTAGMLPHEVVAAAAMCLGLGSPMINSDGDGSVERDVRQDQKLARQVLKRAQFCIFSKKAPSTLPNYDTDSDFSYFYFNDAMAARSGLSVAGLTAGVRNAKSDFPKDHAAYFKDDAQVCMTYKAPKVLDVTEPWVTPLLSTINHTRKTAIELPDGQRFMLGVFFPHDDVSLGVTRFRAGPLPAALPPDEVSGLSDEWCEVALQQLPLPTFVYMTGAAPPLLLRENAAAEAGGKEMEARALAALAKLDDEWANAAEPGAALRPIESWELHESEGQASSVWRQRTFIWRPSGAAWTAISFCPLHASLPPLVANALARDFIM